MKQQHLFLFLALSQLLLAQAQIQTSTLLIKKLVGAQDCSKSQFRCAIDGSCIPLTKVQDGVVDCLDASDEECLPWQFDCQFGSPRCIAQYKVNDGAIDCYTGFDEGCPSHYFICHDRSACIDFSKYQDGIPHCRDKSDEPCQAGYFLCNDRTKCIEGNKFQDNTEDCSDGSDEECTVTQFECPCGKVRCIDVEKIKDGKKDCEDGADETGNLNPKTCPDGTAARVSKEKNRTVQLTVHNAIQQCQKPDLCRENLGETCIMISGMPHCVCKKGTVKPSGFTRCVSEQRLQQYLNNIIANCSNIANDLIETYNSHTEFNVDPSIEPKVWNISCDPQKEYSCKGVGEVCKTNDDGKAYCVCKDGQPRIDGICLVNECADPKLNDCDPNASCMDSISSYECFCNEGFIDVSSSPTTRPGVNCTKLINECSNASLNDCDAKAECIDKPIGYTCRCMCGYNDVSPGGARNPGRKCKKLVDECKMKLADCDPQALCTDLVDGYECRCPIGFSDVSPDPTNRPGQICAQMVSDCSSPGFSGCNPHTSQCVGTNHGFVCRCMKGFIDLNPAVPGVNCLKPEQNPCLDSSLHDCDPVAECFSESPGYFQCQCPKGFTDLSADKRFPGRKCKKIVDECALGTHECDGNADCLDTVDSYSCRCKPGWMDVSPDTLNAPGRVCKKANLCANVKCAPEADCHETQLGPVCECASGYIDISRQHGMSSGRVCKKVVNECVEGKHDCSKSANCIDTEDSYTCRCKDGFRDESPDMSRPGRICVQTFVPQPPECDVKDPLSCDVSKKEVCVFVDGTYKCQCATGYGRLPDGRCLVINECQDKRLNDCSENADCFDQAEGYTCRCRSGFVDVSPLGSRGRICKQRINECSNFKRYHVDCDPHASCIDTDEGYTCRCQPGFADISESFNRLPGRRCVEAVNECMNNDLNDCSENAICEDAKEGYTCTCRKGYVDASQNITHYPGRICLKPRENELNVSNASLDSCDPKSPRCRENEICSDRRQHGTFMCECADNCFRYNDGSCRVSSFCTSSNDCDKNAYCINAFDSYKCQCKPGFIDISTDLAKRPGRKCKQLINECATGQHTCSPYASCIDAADGYICQCLPGFVDTSSEKQLAPGRKCSNASNECLDRSLNTCDENADCIDTPDSYVCKCYIGYVDVSSGANLPPGRVCTVDTTCPKQKTDLIFLIDGSGSIGSYVFKHEVLRFVHEFIELFDIGMDKTRVGLIQYSDQIRHEFDLNQSKDKASVIQAISQVQYLTGLTRTGAAIQHMVVEGFSERRGSRTDNDDVARVAIVITDGRSQDNVTEPSEGARKEHVSMFAVGVTDHVLPSELETISGSASRWFYVDRFKDLDTRLRSLIQKEACPPVQRPPIPPTGCNPQTQTGCNRVLNEICKNIDGVSRCVCPEGFHRNSETQVCGGDHCNPDVKTTCPSPEICQKTPFGNYRCSCPAGYGRNSESGICVLFGDESHPTTVPQDQSTPPTVDCRSHKCEHNQQCILRYGVYKCECAPGFERHPLTGMCKYPNECTPADPNTCDARKREKCLLHATGHYYTCQCASGERRDPATEVCLRDECALKIHDCDVNAQCIDTYDGYLCSCKQGFLDRSPDPANKPGRKCIKQRNECLEGTHHCSPNAICTDTPDGYVCKCKPGFIDYSPNPQNFGGIVCQEIIDECANPTLNNCHKDAICVDTADSYKCVCKPGYVDMDELRNPGKNCQKETTNDKCIIGNNDCDKNARCIPEGKSNYVCACPGGFRDKSPDPTRPGRVCIPLIPECDNPSLNDCDSPDRAICIETDDGYLCRCRQGFYDISPDKTAKPGRLCKALVNECEEGTHDCAPEGGICEDTPDSFTCRCAINFYDVSYDPKNRPGRNCKRLINECETGQNDCSPDAECKDTQDSYICSCKAGYVDVSPDTVNRSGRRCLLRVNECEKKLHDCSVNADCIDTTESYTCKCRDDFVDESPERQKHPGRVCVPALVDECRSNKHNCDPNAVCKDLPQGYTCQCKSDFIDESANRLSEPGRKCVRRPAPPPAECSINVQTSCKVELNEVCRMVKGVPKCACPTSYSRDSITKACTVINECDFPQLNDCHPNAECIDEPSSYTCRCRSGYMDVSPKDKPGRSCQPLVNECEFSHLHDCHQNALCIDKEDGYECKCQDGFVDRLPSHPGRLCKKLINECLQSSLNSCDKNAKCFDEEDGYRCECNENYLDISPSPTMRGRACKLLVNECEDPKLNDCDKNATCTDTTDSYTCECPPNSRDISPNLAFPGRVCMFKKIYCATGQHDCDPKAICTDNEQSFTCTCPDGYVDRSPNKLSRPGRVCVELIDECSSGRHTCSPQAECRDLEEGYTCECKEGYIDRSPNMASQPGRVCGTPEVCPSNHECSSAAVCEPLGGNKYECTCIQGYVDQSPAGLKGRVCVRNNACRDPRLNNCSRNAICYDEPNGYRCECSRGYIDRSPEGGLPGRVCELPQTPTPPPRHPCQDLELNDCHPAGTCRATGPDTYTCECLRGYEDRSPDKDKPGRNCVLTLPVCLDREQNDCHSAAICSETDTEEKYTCRCRDGYLDKSPDLKRPGRLCVEEVNECLDASLNDCDLLAICKDLPDGFTCQCPINTEDRSPDPTKPGRKCFVPINECKNSALNNCSRFATCIDKPDGYECKCLNGYHDKNPDFPGTICNFIINECEQPKLNDCHQKAECIDTEAGYDCKCIPPYKDEKPELPGRLCTFNECSEPSMNTCDINADCVDLESGYTCICKAGFYDESPNLSEPGRRCTKYGVTQAAAPPTGTPQAVPTCGNFHCRPELNEFCVGGVECLCKPDEGRSSPDEVCQKVIKTPLLLRVLHRDDEKLIYTSEIGKSNSVPNIEISKLFSSDMGRSIAGTSYAPRYVTTEVNYVTHPKTVNSSWPDGLLFSFSVATTPTGSPVDKCDLWKQLMESLQRTNGAIGKGSLTVAPDVELLDPCREVPPPGIKCGNSYCNPSLGEVCIANAVCGCPRNEKRTSPTDKCYAVESWAIPVWVIRKGETNLIYNSTFADPTHPLNKDYVQRFESGMKQSYSHTPFKDSFVAVEVIEIADPMTVNATWDAGILYNCTLYFRKGSVSIPSEAYRALIRYIIDENSYQIGTSSLYINPYQQSIFDACFKNDCHPKGLCHPLGPNAYRCECGSGYRDLKPNDPGRHCLPSLYNECLNKEDNECSENARCIDQKYLYKCECIKPYVDAAPSGKLPGSVCVLDYCSDVNFCPVNTTCVNLEEQAKCECESGYVDIRDSPVRLQHYGPEVICILETERNECLLGLTDCASVAECVDLPKGYECRCPEGYIDGNPEKPGRFCAAKRCDMCNEHGTCVYSADNTNATCACEAGWSGEFCNIAPSKASMILLIILALLFLLLTLCCLLYFCTKCVCFKGHKRGWPWDTMQSVSSESASTSGHEAYPEFGGIPRVTVKKDAVNRGDLARRMDVSDLENYIDGDYRIPRVGAIDADAISQSSSEYTWREEVVRTVTTDVTKTETHKTITNADVHDTTAEFHVYPPLEAAADAESSSQVTVRKRSASMLHKDEQERGESVAEFSIGNANHEYGESRIEDKRVSEYSTDRDAESVRSESVAEDDIYDKRTLVRRNHGYEPGAEGDRYWTEVTTTTSTKNTSKY